MSDPFPPFVICCEDTCNQPVEVRSLNRCYAHAAEYDAYMEEVERIKKEKRNA